MAKRIASSEFEAAGRKITELFLDYDDG